MAIKKIQMIPPGYTDIVHPETDSTMVLMGDGNTLQVKYDAHMANTEILHAAYGVDTANATDAYTVAIAGITDYAQLTGKLLLIKVNTANTTGATLNVNSLGAKNIYRGINVALLTGDIVATKILLVVYDGTNFQLLSQGVDVSQATKTETLSNKTLTSPKFADGGFIADANGNEALGFTTTANAVNYPNIKNSATGAPVEIQALGGDTDIGIKLTPKGAGVATVPNNTAYTTAQIRNVILGTVDPTGGGNGDLYCKYQA